jgi:hypothetical protein
MASDARYRFGPLERRGLIGGWRSGQVAGVGTGLAAAVGLVRADPRLAGVAAALLCLAVSFAVVSWSVRGRTIEQWLPVVAGWTGRRVRGAHRFRSAVPVLGLPGPSPARRRSGSGPDLIPGPEEATDPLAESKAGGKGAGSSPQTLAGCRILAPRVEDGARRVGVVHDARAQTYSAVLAMAGAGLPLLGNEERHARIAAWAEVLAGLAREGSALHRVQWVERSLPGPALPAGPQALCGPGPAQRSYEELLETVGAKLEHHEVLLAVSVRAERGPRFRGDGADAGACAALVRELRSFETQLEDAGFPSLGALAPRALVLCLRNVIDVRPRPLGMGGPGVAPWWPWPLASETTWASYRTGGTWHATYWVAEWPRLPVGPDFLGPVLLQGPKRRAVAVTMEPLGPERALRQAEHDRTAHLADAELRRRVGYLTTARRRREHESAAARELELADGHAPYRFSGYITVTAETATELETSCRRLEQAAAHARLSLLRLFGQQDEAFTWTLPLARGLA